MAFFNNPNWVWPALLLSAFLDALAFQYASRVWQQSGPDLIAILTTLLVGVIGWGLVIIGAKNTHQPGLLPLAWFVAFFMFNIAVTAWTKKSLSFMDLTQWTAALIGILAFGYVFFKSGSLFR